MNKTLTSIALAGLTLVTGCATKYPGKNYDLNCRLICKDQEEIQKLYDAITFSEGTYCAGFQLGSDVYVRWSGKKDKNGEPLPDFETLGHEVWHIIKGGYHK